MGPTVTCDDLWRLTGVHPISLCHLDSTLSGRKVTHKLRGESVRADYIHAFHPHTSTSIMHIQTEFVRTLTYKNEFLEAV